MSPEQAEGAEVDQRSDIWSFGVVVYEMLTGARLFGGDSVQRVLAKVLERDVDSSALPPATPASIRRLLRRCLERDRRRRLHHIADARVEIEDALAGAAHEPASLPIAQTRPGTRWLLWALGALAVILAVTTGLAVWRLTRTEAAPVARFEITTPPDAPPRTLGSIRMSPCRQTERVWSTDPATGAAARLHLRRSDQVVVTPLRGSERAKARSSLRTVSTSGSSMWWRMPEAGVGARRPGNNHRQRRPRNWRRELGAQRHDRVWRW